MSNQLHNESWEQRLIRLAASRHGVFSREQAIGLGASRHAIHHRIETGRWRALHRGVYAIGGQPATWRQALMAAILSVGETTVASHRSAAALWRLPGFDEGPIEVTTMKTGRHRRSFSVHRAAEIPRAHLTRIDAIPVTAIERTLVDVATADSEAQVEIALDDALRRRIVTVGRLDRYVRSIRGPGRRGAALMGDLLSERSDGRRGSESPLETMLFRMLRKHRIPLPTLQHWVRLDGRRFRIDFCYPDHMIAIEGESRRHHSSKRDWQRDLARRNLLTAAGWRVIHVTWEDLRERETETAERIRAMLGGS